MKLHRMRLRGALVLLTALAMSACGGGGGSDGGSSPNANTPFGIVTTPSDGATEVDVRPTITATFAPEMDASTITEASFTLTAAGTVVAGTVSYDEATRTATYIPSTSLPSKASCTATLSGDIKTNDGQTIAASYSWTFTLRDRAWSEPEIITEYDASEMPYVRVGISDVSNALVMWNEKSSTETHMKTRSYEMNTGWTAEQQFETEVTGMIDLNISQMTLSMNGAGDAIASWIQSDGTITHALTSVYRNAAGWGIVDHMEEANVRGQYARSVMGANGIAFIVWGDPHHVNAARNIPGEGWSAAVQLDTSTYSHYGRSPDVAVSANGKAAAVWSKFDGAGWCVQYDPSSGWTEPIQIYDDGDSIMNDPAIAIDDNGTVTVVAYRKDTLIPFALRSLDNGEWSAATDLSSTADLSSWIKNRSLVIDAQGNLMYAWLHNNELLVARKQNGKDWSPAETITPNSVAAFPSLTIAPDGHAMLAWLGSAGFTWSSYSEADGWIGGEQIDRDGKGQQGDIAMNSAGDAIAAWSSCESSHCKILARFYR